MKRPSPATISRRLLFARMGGLVAACALPRVAFGQTGKRIQPIDATFLFVADIHACRMASGLSPNCLQEGKTDAALLRNVAALNAIADKKWPAEINGVSTGLHSAGTRIG
ncbi:MAG: metallophosphoesterase, partial [Mesorhizobium sp.]